MIQSFNGKTPRIAPSAFISEAAHIIGDVEIGPGCSVWPGAVIRGDFGSIRIGAGSAIEDNCVLHSGSLTGPGMDLTVGEGAQIGHGAVLNCVRVGNHVLIGINATVLHDVEIGDYCVVGAGCLVSQGMKVPTGSFVAGVPGTIRGEISENQRLWLEQAPKQYLSLVELYRKGSTEDSS